VKDYITDIGIAQQIEQKSSAGKKLFERLGGRPTLDRVHKIFYEKLYQHSWIGKYFAGIDQTHISGQQSDFMGMLFGGPKIFQGRMPIDAHVHMMITEELFAVRHQLLREALVESKIPDPEFSEWLAVDAAFKKVLIKKSVDDCQKRFNSDEIVNHPQ
jgi:truncated hemoglobin YjbI